MSTIERTSDATNVDAMYIDLLKRCLSASLYDESAWRVLEARRSPEVTLLKHPVWFAKAVVRQATVRLLRRGSLEVVERRPFDRQVREQGKDWPLFAYTMIGHRRLDNIQFCVEEIVRNNVPGDLIETGVWRGGAVIFMRALLKLHSVTDRVVWAADSFEGMPVPTTSSDGGDYSQQEYLTVSLDDVRANFTKFNLLDDQVRFLKGWFCDTLPGAPIEQLALLRLDGDLYTSTMDALENLYHRVSPGGYVIVDDYYSWPSCRRAVTDFLEKRNVRVALQRIDDDAIFWKVDRAT